MWVLLDFKKPQGIPELKGGEIVFDGPLNGSAVYKFEFDCTNQTYTDRYIIMYSGKMANGIINSSTDVDLDIRNTDARIRDISDRMRTHQIPPGDPMENILQICN